MTQKTFQNQIIRFLLWAFLFCGVYPGFFGACSRSERISPKAVNGVLDLRNWDFREHGNLNLDGEWEFYWEILSRGNNSEIREAPKNIISVPRSWKDFVINKIGADASGVTLGSQGYATYRLKILLPQESTLALRIPEISSAYEIYIDETLVHKSGVVGTSPESSQPTKKNIYLYQVPVNREFTLTIPVSSFHSNRSGIILSIQLGSPDSIRNLRDTSLSTDIFLFGSLFILGIYHISIFFLRREDVTPLLFAFSCILSALRVIVTGEKVLYAVPGNNYYSHFFLEYLSNYFGVPVFVAFLSTLFPEEFNKKIIKFIHISSFLLFLTILFLNTYYYTRLATVFQLLVLFTIIVIIYSLIKSIIKKRSGALVFLVGFLIFSLTIVNDVLYARNIINTGYFTPIGLLVFTLSQSYLLSSRFSRAFRDVKSLSTTLQVSNRELETSKERVTKAYLELEASQKQLVQSDKMITLGTMVAGVAHEINTPLAAIKSNSENISESLKGLILKINPKRSLIKIEDLEKTIQIIELSRELGTPLSSREARALKKKIVSILEERNQKNVELLSEYIIDLGLVEALEKEGIFLEPEIEKYLSLASDLLGIRRKSNVIQVSSERVSKIVKSLKSFMHFDQSEKKIYSDLTEGMETVLIILHNKIKYGIEVTKNYDKNLPQILCYPDELNQVWTNLIHNAIQAMEEKGNLQIDIEKLTNLNGIPDIDKRNPNYNGEYVAVSIQDSGSGIPPEIRSKIFQAFFTTKSAGEGSGLGLHIIGKILEKHFGALYLESEPGRTRFTVVLPIQENNNPSNTDGNL